MVDVRVSRFGAQVAETGDQDALRRVTRQQGSVVYADRTYPIRVSKVQFQTQYADRTHPVRVTHQFLQVLISDVQNVRPPRLERELNPFRPTMPREIAHIDPVLGDFIQLQTETLREQHNKTQAGDSTAPWEFLTKIGPEPQFTLGALGRFYHDDYGLIVGRYVRFSNMVEGSWTNGPVGRLSSATDASWVVTNSFELSSPDDVVGILPHYELPTDGWYGWVIVQGTNITDILIRYDSNPANQTPLVWERFETLASYGEGRVIARLVGPIIKKGIVALAKPGSLLIDLEGASADSIKKLVAGDIDGMKAELEKIQESLGQLPDTDALAALAKKVNALQQRIGNEEKVRKAADKDLDTRLKALEGGQNDEELKAWVLQITNDLNARLNAVQEQANATAELLASYGIPGMQVTIGLMQDQIDELNARIKPRLVPMVDGSVPPNLVYTPDGDLVFLEIE